jgi:hypothetical protein
VSVDWVSAAMAYLVAHPEYHARTYHLTNPRPETTLSMREAMTEVLAEVAETRPQPARSIAASEDTAAAFRDQMSIYRSYWSDDPEFDSTNTEQALPHLPCPRIDHEVMARLVRFAIGSNFGWPREAPLVPRYDIGAQLECWRGGWETTDWEQDHLSVVNLCVTGPGVGQWQLATREAVVMEVGLGLRAGAATCFLSSSTFVSLVQRRLTLVDAIIAGRLVVAGNGPHLCELAKLFTGLGSPEQKRILQKVTIG